MTLADHFAEQAKPGQAPVRKFEKARPAMTDNRPARNAADSDDDSKNKRMLTVGPQTCMKGEISRCDRVMIEGEVDAEMADVDLLEISEDGVFRGTAKVGNAEISGRFDGDLTVTGRLVVYEQGLVNGKISYGEIQVMRGGRVVGEIRCPDLKDISKDMKSKAVA
jgi:cytoskeletal protein CcmA (bactofilin family)